MLFVYPTPQYPRRPMEYAFKFLYMIATVSHVVAMVVLITDFYTRLKDSMPDYYTSKELRVSPGITMVMENCTYKGPLTISGVRGDVEVGLGAITIGLMNTAMYIEALFVTEFLLIFNNCVCSLNYSSGNRHLRIFGVHVPYYHITIVFTYLYSIAIVVLTWVCEGNKNFYHRTLVYCAAELQRTYPGLLISSEYGDYSIFTTAVYWPFAAVCLSTVIYLAAVIVLFVNSSDKATVLLSQADAPWESTGIMASTKKPLLKLHTAQRNAIIDDARAAIKEGEKVRIVRSYQLMTDEDFQALVQAMRDQVARALKEKQFEKLRENFGDRESQIDDMGFLWRQQMMAPDPNQLADGAGGEGSGDQFYDVNFDDYFTENDYANDNGNRGLDGMGGELNQRGPDGLPVASPPSLVEYNDDALFPPEEEDYGEMDGGDMQPPEFYVGDGNYGENYNENYGVAGGDDDGWGAGPDDNYYGNEDYDEEPLYSHGNPYDEPDPRSPGLDDYSPQEGGGGVGHDDYNWPSRGGGGGGDGRRAGGGRGKKRKGGGRQAEVEDDLVDADALSDVGNFY